MRKPVTFIVGLLAAVALSLATQAAEYPTRPVTLVVAFTPGGPSDVLSRIIGKRLNEILHQPFIIENRPGSGGNIAAEQVAHATPDGYTLLMGNNSILATYAALYKRLNYDAQKDFAPISLIGTQPNILVVNPNVPANSMAELIALAKARPGELNFASSGFGAAAHIVAQVAAHQERKVYAFTRPGDIGTQEFARSLGAVWAGGSDEMPPRALDAALIFAPVGDLVRTALLATAKGGTVVSGGIYMSDIPSIPYALLWEERIVRSVANLTRKDGLEFMAIADKVEMQISVEPFELAEANQALERLRRGRLEGAAVLAIA